MKNDKPAWQEECIPLPTETEKQQSIDFILNAALPMAAARCPARGLLALLQGVGLRGLLFGVEDCAFLALLLAGAVWALLLVPTLQTGWVLCGVTVFLASPLLYAALHLLTLWKEVLAGVYEQKMVCRYTLRQMTALRMLAFGVASCLLFVPLGAALAAAGGAQAPLPRVLGLAFAGLFFYAAAELALSERLPVPWGWAAAPAVWCVLGGALGAAGERAAGLLAAIPTAAFWLAAALCAAVYFHLLYRYCTNTKEGALRYGRTHTVC